MIRILLAHPSRFVCDSLRAALDNVEDVYVVGCARTAEELHFLLPHGNVVLIGTELKDANALELLEEIRLTHPGIKSLILGVDDRPEIIIRYIEAGAAGYILENESIDDMVEKLHAASEMKAIISPSVAGMALKRLSELANLETPYAVATARQSQLDDLTPREEEVLDLINAGCSNQEIANQLYIECGTVKNHVHNILRKLEVNNRHEAAAVFQMCGKSATAVAA